MDTLIFRYGPDIMISTVFIWLYIHFGRTRKIKVQRIKLLLQRVLPIVLIALLFCFVVVPGIFGPFFKHARYLPQIIEAHKLRFYWQIACAIPGIRASDTDIQHAIDQVAAEYTMHPDLIRALVRVESSNNQFAISSLGACGLTQVMPNTYYSLGRGNPFALKPNLRAGTQYIRHLYRRFDGNLELALAAYNAGPGAVARRKKVPSGSVRRYVDKVTWWYHHYRSRKK